MKLVNPNLNRLKKMKLVRLSKVLVISTSLIFLSGCNSVDTDNYYIVSKDGNYSLCSREYHFASSDDYEYDSVIDGDSVGLICSNGDNFDYEKHRITTKFLCELQVVNLKDAIENDKLSKEAIRNLATSDVLYDIAENYFINKKYYYEQDFDYGSTSTLKMFTTEDKLIVGYDISPKRLSNTMKYVYSIIDNDTLTFRENDIISTVEFEGLNNNNYITYNDAVDIINEYNVKKYALEK